MTLSKTVNYAHKLVLGPKKSILKFNGLSDIPFFKPVFTLHYPQNAKIAFTDNLIFKILPIASLAHVWSVSSLDRTPFPSASKKTTYRPDAYDTMTWYQCVCNEAYAKTKKQTNIQKQTNKETGICEVRYPRIAFS